MRNKIFLTIYGETKNLREWSKDPRCKVTYSTLKSRNVKGCSSDKILNAPGEVNIIEENEFKQKMYQLYIVENKSIAEIARIFSKNDYYIAAKLKKYNIPRKNPPTYKAPAIGTKFNKLEYLGESKGKYGHPLWKMKCECNHIVYMSYYNVSIGKTKTCRYCVNKGNRAKWSGYEEISGSFFSKINRNAKKRNLEFNITIKDIWDLYIKQDRKCALTGQPIFFDRKSNPQIENCSLDRIDSHKGYILDNIQLTTKKINMAKQNLNNEEFINLCRNVVNNIKNRDLWL